MAVFPLLADPDSYRACEWDLLVDPAGRDYWLGLFREHVATLRTAALEAGASGVQCATLERELNDRLDALVVGGEPTVDRLDILTLDAERTAALRSAGILDAFSAIKARETAAALELLPARLAALEALEPSERPLELARGVFAGNIFDLGAVAVAREFLAGASIGFARALGSVKARPWLVDEAARLRFTGYRKAIIFVDNAGPDVTLGMLPLARELLRGGTEVVLAANSSPALNDITFGELEALLAQAGCVDPQLARALETRSLRPIATGTGAPLLDLADVSEALCGEAADADLVVLEGMGRALESNYSATFTCASWRIGTLKDPFVASRFGGGLYDCICRVQDAPGRASPPEPLRS